METGGDRSIRAMRALYRLGYENYPDTWFEKGDLFKLMATADNEDLAWFGSFSEEEVRSTKPKIGLHLRKFRGRELDGIILQIDASQTKVRTPAAPLRRLDHHPARHAACPWPGFWGGLGELGAFRRRQRSGRIIQKKKKNNKRNYSVPA